PSAAAPGRGAGRGAPPQPGTPRCSPPRRWYRRRLLVARPGGLLRRAPRHVYVCELSRPAGPRHAADLPAPAPTLARAVEARRVRALVLTRLHADLDRDPDSHPAGDRQRHRPPQRGSAPAL